LVGAALVFEILCLLTNLLYDLRIMKFQNLFSSAVVITCILITAPSPAQQLSGFETPPIRKSSEVLPPSLIQGEHFKVRDQVAWKGGLHLFTVDSDFGPFEV